MRAMDRHPTEGKPAMDRSKFAAALRQGIVDGLREFCEQHSAETLYGYALLGQTSGDYLGCAFATEEGLRQVAARYAKLGYRYVLFKSERLASTEELATWLRWANPDDGWYFDELPEHDRVQTELHALVEAGELGDGGADLEEFCTDVLASLQNVPAWQEEMARAQVVVGFTYGQDPRDFLRTATRANPYSVVKRLWSEMWAVEEIGSRIKSPRK